MKIENGNINPLNRLSGVSSRDRDNAVKPAKKNSGTTDAASVSGGAQTLAKAMEALNSTPDVRADFLETLRSKIMNGEYEIKYEELARRIASKTYLA